MRKIIVVVLSSGAALGVLTLWGANGIKKNRVTKNRAVDVALNVEVPKQASANKEIVVDTGLPTFPPAPTPKPALVEPEPDILPMGQSMAPAGQPSPLAMPGGVKEFAEIAPVSGGMPSAPAMPVAPAPVAAVPAPAMPTVAMPVEVAPAVAAPVVSAPTIMQPMPAQPEIKLEGMPGPAEIAPMLPVLKGKMEKLTKELAETITESIIGKMREEIYKKVTKDIEDLIAKSVQGPIK